MTKICSLLHAPVRQLELVKLEVKINFSRVPRTLLQQEAEKLIEDTVGYCGSLSIHYGGADTVSDTALSSAGNCRVLRRTTSQFCELR